MEVLNASRIGIAAQAVGVAQAAFEQAVEYAKQRKVFGKTISEMQGIQWMIADMATEVEAARLLVMQAATLLDAGRPFVKEASMAKLFASRVAVETADKAVQIHGGVGYFSPVDSGAPVPRRQDNRNLRGHVRDPAHDNLAERARGLSPRAHLCQ